jgi:hypothetical protein
MDQLLHFAHSGQADPDIIKRLSPRANDVWDCGEGRTEVCRISPLLCLSTATIRSASETRRRLLPSLNKGIFRVGSVGFGTPRRLPIACFRGFRGFSQRVASVRRFRRAPRIGFGAAGCRRGPRSPRRARVDHRAHRASPPHERLVSDRCIRRVASARRCAAVSRDRDAARSRRRGERSPGVRRRDRAGSLFEARGHRSSAPQGRLVGLRRRDRARSRSQGRSARPPRVRHLG